MKNIASLVLLIVALLGFCGSSALANGVVPESGSTALMLGLGLAGFALLARRLRK